MTYREAIHLGEKVLSIAGVPDVKTDAWLLFEYVAKIDRHYYYTYIDEDITEQTLA